MRANYRSRKLTSWRSKGIGRKPAAGRRTRRHSGLAGDGDHAARTAVHRVACVPWPLEPTAGRSEPRWGGRPARMTTSRRRAAPSIPASGPSLLWRCGSRYRMVDAALHSHRLGHHRFHRGESFPPRPASRF